jgi:hypothetical protein
MKLDEIEVEIPKEQLTEKIVRRYVREPYGAVIGSFDPQFLVVHARPPGVHPNEQGYVEIDSYLNDLKARLDTGVDLAHNTRMLLEQTVWSHEIEHFHDTVCTPGGIEMFLREWILAAQLYSTLKELRISGWRSSGPLWRDRRAVQAFNLYTNIILYRLIYNGDLDPIQAEPEYVRYDIVWGKIRAFERTFRVPYFPSNVFIEGAHASLLTPIGFRGLTECRAVGFQNTILRSFGQEYVDALRKLLSPHPEYGVVNRFVTRVTKKNGLDPHEQWGGEAIFRLSGAALFDQGGKAFERTPGMALVDIVRGVEAAELPTATFWKENVSNAAAMRESAFLTAIPPAPDEWSGYQVRDFALSCYRRSVDVYAHTNPTPFPPDSTSWYTVSNPKLPQPWLSLQGDEIGYSGLESLEKIGKHLSAVSAWIMLRSLFEDSIWDGEITCPVLEGPYTPLLRFNELHPYCPTGIASGGCGRVAHGADLSGHPDCPFRHALIDIGLAR